MKKILVLGLIIILLTGCLPQQIEPTTDVDDIIATLVAATLTSGTTIKGSIRTRQLSRLYQPSPRTHPSRPSKDQQPTLTPSPPSST